MEFRSGSTVSVLTWRSSGTSKEQAKELAKLLTEYSAREAVWVYPHSLNIRKRLRGKGVLNCFAKVAPMIGRGGRWVLLVSLVSTVLAETQASSVEHGGQVEVVARVAQDPCLGVCSGSRQCVVQSGRPYCVDCTGLLKRKSTGTPFAECCSYDAENLTCASAVESTTLGTCKRSQQLFARLPEELPLEDELSTCNDVEPTSRTASNKDACSSAQFFYNNDLACSVKTTRAGKVKCINRDGTADRTCRPKTRSFQLGQDIDGIDEERLGYSVAMSADGTRMIVGSLLYGESGNLGRAQVYELRGEEGWVKVGQDLVPGWSVAISEDGTRVAVGQILDETVRVYELAPSEGWIQVGQDIVSSRAGWSVVFSAGGNRVAIGAIGADGVNGSSSGSVRVYDLRDGEWVQVGEAIDGESEDDSSGFSLAMSSDGRRLAIGAIGSANLAGQVRVFELVEGEGWIQLGQDIDGDRVERLGWSVAMSEDGTRVAVGAPGGSNVRVYDFEDDDEEWVQVGLTIDEGIADSGSAVALSGDGRRLVVGAGYSGANGARSGAVLVYDFVEGKGWKKLTGEMRGTEAEENAGRAVAVSADGTRVLVGAPENSQAGSGYARVFQLIESC